MKPEQNWKSAQLQKMRIIANRIADENKKHKEVCAVLLFGSVATGNIHPQSDIDLIIVKDLEEQRIQRHQPSINGINVDQWVHSLTLYTRLINQNWRPDEMFFYSLFLNILQNCEILYDKESQFNEYRESALEWKWSEECKEFIQGKYYNAIQGLRASDITLFETLIYLRKIVLLDTCKLLLDLGKPISNRNKDLYEKHIQFSPAKDFEIVFKVFDLVELEKLVEQCFSFFHSEIKDREPFTELMDARKYLVIGDPFVASISLQNGAFYVGRSGLRNRGVSFSYGGFVNPEAEVELIRESREMWPDFWDFYNKVHDVERWSTKQSELIKELKTKYGA